jgi:hypothetical protein
MPFGFIPDLAFGFAGIPTNDEIGRFIEEECTLSEHFTAQGSPFLVRSTETIVSKRLFDCLFGKRNRLKPSNSHSVALILITPSLSTTIGSCVAC